MSPQSGTVVPPAFSPACREGNINLAEAGRVASRAAGVYRGPEGCKRRAFLGLVRTGKEATGLCSGWEMPDDPCRPQRSLPGSEGEADDAS
jgi:hypothetical protein